MKKKIKRDKAFYQKIGAMGGKKTAEKGSEHMSKLGKKGHKAMIKVLMERELDKQA